MAALVYFKRRLRDFLPAKAGLRIVGVVVVVVVVLVLVVGTDFQK